MCFADKKRVRRYFEINLEWDQSGSERVKTLVWLSSLLGNLYSMDGQCWLVVEDEV